MAQGFQSLVGVFSIPSGSSSSTIISGSDVDVFEKITIYTPTSFVSTIPLILEVNFSPTMSSTAWRQYRGINTLPMAMSASAAHLIDAPGTFGLRLSGSIQTAAVEFPIVGSYLVDVKAVPNN